MDAFTEAYLIAALFSSCDDNGRPLDDRYTADDIAPESLARAVADCAAFQTLHADAIGDCASQAGHDLWLTRNGHGAGFWDGDWPEPAATELTAAAHCYGESYPYVGDDGRIYFA